MVTAEEIGASRLFATLDRETCERLARAAADVSLVAGRVRSERGGRSRVVRGARGPHRGGQGVDGIERVVGERLPGDVFGEVPIALGTVFPVGFRAAEPSRVLRIEPAEYHAIAAAAPIVAKSVGALAATDERTAGPAGHRGRAAAAAGDRGRAALGRRVRASCATSSTATRSRFRWLQPDAPDAAEAVGRRRCPPRTTCPAIRLVGGKTVVRPQLRRVAELLGLGTEPQAAEYDTVIVGAGPAGPRGRRLRRLGGSAHARRRARGARRPGRHVVADRELPRLPVGRLRRRAREPRAAAGAAARRRDPRDARRSRASTPRRARSTWTAATCCRRGRSSSPAASRGGASTIEGFDRLVGKGIFYGAARSEAPNVARARRAHRRRGQLGGAGGDVLLDPRAERDDPLPRRQPREEHVALPGRPARDAARTSTSLPQRRSRRAHGDDALEAIDVRERERGDDDAARVRRALHLHRRRRRDRRGCRRRSRSTAAATCSPGPTCAPPGGGSSTATRYLLETSVPGIFACGDVRSGPVKRVAAAVGEGSMAIAFVHQYLREPG